MERSWRPRLLGKKLEKHFREVSLGPDDFSMAFFQDNWDLLKVELERVFEFFFFVERGILNRSILKTVVCLMPNKENANRVKDFRPISLITSVYKILT